MSKHLTILSIASIALFVAAFSGPLSQSFLGGLNIVTSVLPAQTVGITVGVAPNEVTELAQEVTQKQEELELRELAVQEREEAIVNQTDSVNFLSTEVYFTIMAFILLLLVLLNFYLDFRRGRVEPWEGSQN